MKRAFRSVWSLLTWPFFLIALCHIMMFNIYNTEKSNEDKISALDLPPDLHFSDERAFKTLSRKERRNRDVIVYLAQFSKFHSSYGLQYDAKHVAVTGLDKLKRSLDLLYQNYLEKFPTSDVIIFYDSKSSPDSETMTALSENRSQIKFLELNHSWWELPYGLQEKDRRKWRRTSFSIGYRHMIRWFAILIWRRLEAEGYTHVMRMDDDSYIHSKIEYNLFDFLRKHNKRYAFRQACRDNAVGRGYDQLIETFLQENPSATSAHLIDSYKTKKYHRLGFYNNWFMADISFFMNSPVSTLIDTIDKSKLIYTERTGDLVIHSTLVRLFLRPEEIHWFQDFTYEHMTLCRKENCGARSNGCPQNGGISRGLGVYSDIEWNKFATNVLEQFRDNPDCTLIMDENFVGSDDSVWTCSKANSNCGDFLKQFIGESQTGMAS